MPRYEYRCPRCGILELEQKITAPPKRRCPHCRERITRLISRSSFILTGGSWYKPGMSA